MAALQRDALDEAVLAALRDVDDLAFDPLCAVSLGELAQEARIENRIEMIGVGDLRERGIGAERRWAES